MAILLGILFLNSSAEKHVNIWSTQSTSLRTG